MLNRVLWGVAILAMAATPVFAGDACGTRPIPPAIPTSGDLAKMSVEDAHKDVVATNHLIKTYQGSLATFRGCLKKFTDDDTNAIAEAKAKPDDAAVKAAQDRIDARQVEFNKAYDDEANVVADYTKMLTAHCTRDTAWKICQPPK